MTSDAQRAANRRNARTCTGPLSLEGKQRSRLNGVRHGLATTATMVLPDEDVAAFEDLREALWRDLAPDGGLQEQLVERACLLLWRLARAGRLETAIYAYRRLVVEQRAIGRRQHHRRSRLQMPALYADEDYAAEGEAERRAELEQAIEDAVLAPAFLEDTHRDCVFDRLSRYERGLQRSLEQTLDRLARLQRQQAAETRATALTLEGEADAIA